MLDAVERNQGRQFVVLGGSTTANLNFPLTKDGVVLLMIAAANGNIQILNLMLANRNLDINKKDRHGVNAFWIAAFYSKIEFMDCLRQAGADMYATNQNGSNALHIAVKRNNVDVVRYLMEQGYKLDMPKLNGVTPLGIAAFKGFINLLAELHRGGADPNYLHSNGITPLYLAIKANQYDSVDYLLQQGVPIFNNHPRHRDNSPIFMALKQKNISMLRALCQQGPVDNLNFMLNSKGQNPIVSAAHNQNWDAVDYLSSRGVLVDVEDQDGLTLLMKVLTYNQFDTAAKLLSRGSDVDAFNREGQTALSYFIRKGKVKVVDFLLKMDANPHIEDFHGQDSCDYATQNGILEFRDLLSCDRTKRVKADKVQRLSAEEVQRAMQHQPPKDRYEVRQTR